MQSKTYARARGAVQWNTGRSSRLTVFSARKGTVKLAREQAWWEPSWSGKRAG